MWVPFLSTILSANKAISSTGNFCFTSFPLRLYLFECMVKSLNGIPSVNVGSKFYFFQNDNLVNLCLVCLSWSSGMKIVLEFGIAFGKRVLNLNEWTNFSSPAIFRNLGWLKKDKKIYFSFGYDCILRIYFELI